MQLLPLLVAVILGASALAFVLYPLYRQSYAKTQASGKQSRRGWQENPVICVAITLSTSGAKPVPRFETTR